ncbi:MAG: hypothetical protein ACYTJ0_11135 [Planctomycetota bacterium]|jgi:hypothetical protein
MSDQQHPTASPADDGPEAPSAEGRSYAAAAGTLLEGIETAFDYRGDVTIVRRSGEPVEGYLFDRRRGDSLESSSVRVIARPDGRRLTIAGADIAELHLSGRDTAAGKSFETWMRKYVEKKLAGETASIESEPLE